MKKEEDKILTEPIVSNEEFDREVEMELKRSLTEMFPDPRGDNDAQEEIKSAEDTDKEETESVDELDKDETGSTEDTDKEETESVDELDKGDTESAEDTSEETVPDLKKKKKHMKWWKKVLIAVGSLVAVLAIALVVVYQVFIGRVNYETEEDWKIKESPSNVSTIEVTPEPEAEKIEEDDIVKNFLLVGIENHGYSESADEGNTDCMIILSINQKTNSVKMVSLMRDIYVVMPKLNRGTKLNNVYNNGSGKLLTETIEHLLGITIDGRAVVKYTDFEKIIDCLGGVNITLTQAEASYLNRTNYISNPSNRHVSAGKNKMNGNQALGYVRVRKVSTVDGGHDNAGRNERQRTVLMSLYKKYKEKSLMELTSLVYDVLPLIYKTNIGTKDAIDVVSVVKDMNIKKIENLNLPLEDTYHSQHAVEGINPNVMNDFQIIDDINANKKALKKFLMGDEKEGNTSASPSVSPSAYPAA